MTDIWDPPVPTPVITASEPAKAVVATFAADDEGLTRPEPRSRKLIIHAAAIVALAVSLAYLIWRVGFTLGTSLWLSIPLWL